MNWFCEICEIFDLIASIINQKTICISAILQKHQSLVFLFLLFCQEPLNC